ncbi:SLATT domain-containing protein [Nocardioides aurantiacus]|uniref:SLATT domain-containing protein n=1 Tax=Nocardioides aurantiacus TaxID=86796 RepID=UPI00147681A9|nr:SLATT domain-containing protein [Nocardioides aurantiacus]
MTEPTQSDANSQGGTSSHGAGRVGGQEDWLEKFERRTYTTFVSRARASERLGVRGMLWMIALSVASASTLCASVVSLANGPRPVSQADLGTTLFSLATLVLSLIVAALNYQSRSRDLFHSFRAIQRVSSQAESLRYLGGPSAGGGPETSALEGAYQDALDQSENHTTLDYHKARRPRQDEHKREDERAQLRATILQGALTALPAVIIAVSLFWIVFIFVDLR